MAIVDIYLYAGLTPDSDIELSDPTQLREGPGRFPSRSLIPFWATLDAWKPPEPLPWHGRYLVQEFIPADDPPFGYRQPLSLRLRPWEPRPLTPIIVGHSIFAPEREPALIPHPSFWIILRAWQPRFPIERWVDRPALLFPQQQAPDDPPFGLKTPLWPILAAWQPGPPLPWHASAWVVQEFTTPSEDPPFGLKTPYWPILAAWQPGPPLPWHRYVNVVQEFLTPAEDPPFGRRLPIWPVLGAWYEVRITPTTRILIPGSQLRAAIRHLLPTMMVGR